MAVQVSEGGIDLCHVEDAGEFGVGHPILCAQNDRCGAARAAGQAPSGVTQLTLKRGATQAHLVAQSFLELGDFPLKLFCINHLGVPFDVV